MNDVAQGSRTSPRQLHPDGLAPPTDTLNLAKALLAAQHAELSAKRQLQRMEVARIQDKARNLALGHVRARGNEFRQLEEERRKFLEQRVKRNERTRVHQGVGTLQDVHLLAQTGLTFAGPPYDFDWVSNSNQGIEHADRTTGNYDLRVQSIGGGEQTIAAGVGFWFFSGDGNPAQRFAALVDYSDEWWDMADFYVAHNNGRTRLGVFGASEMAWVAQSDQTPSWSDGVGWLESHGNGGEDGTVSNQTFFNAAPNSWYQCWVWSSADVFADSGLWGLSASSINMNISMRLAVLGGLA